MLPRRRKQKMGVDNWVLHFGQVLINGVLSFAMFKAVRCFLPKFVLPIEASRHGLPGGPVTACIGPL